MKERFFSKRGERSIKTLSFELVKEGGVDFKFLVEESKKERIVF